MQNSSCRTISEEEIDKMFREILNEDNQTDEDEDSSESCSECAEENFCECIHIAENSSRFSLRVMEAMRSLQKDENNFLPTSRVENIVDYIQKNYRDDGDLYAQVRTTLKQVCSQGFVMELLENEYHLIGPDASSMNRMSCSSDPRDCCLSSPAKAPKCPKKDKDDSSCETPSDSTSCEETGQVAKKRRRISKGGTRRSNARRKQYNCEKETTDCTCSLTLTDEGTNESLCDDEIQQSARKTQHVPGHLERIHEKWKRSVQEPLMEALRTGGICNQRRMGTGDARNDKVSENLEEIDEDDAEIDNVEDDEESQSQIRSRKAKQTEEELERWIERCQKESERRKNRRCKNN